MQWTRLFDLRRDLPAGLRWIIACIALVPGLTVAQPVPPRNTLVWAVDGFSYEAFQVARQRGLFSRFRHAGRHVAPFPSMSHPSWTEVTGARELFGARGNIRTVEASWFDLDAMRVENDPRQVLARQAAPFNYMRAFDWYFDPLIEPMMYFEGDRLADRELRDAEQHILDSYTGGHQVVFLGAADAIAHTHLDRLHAYLRRLDAMMNRTLDSLAVRGVPVESWIVSDHGNAGAFAEGQTERRLTPVSLDAAVRAAKLVRRDTGRLTAANEVSVVTLALASMVNVYFADLSRRRHFAERALQQPGIALVTWLEVTDDDRRIVILSRSAGEAHLRWRDDGSASYRVVSGNPLQLPERVVARNTDRWMDDSTFRRAGGDGPYPDAVFRLIRSASKDVENAPDLIVSLQDGYCWAGTLGRYVKMVRTHGALGARSTLGLVASTGTVVPHSVRSGEVRALIGLDARTLFQRIASRTPHDARALADSLAHAPAQLYTGRGDTHTDAQFLRRVRPITISAGYFSGDALKTLANVARSDSAARAATGRQLTRTRRALKRTDVIAGVTGNIDTLVALGDSLPELSANSDWGPWLETAEQRFRGIPALAPLTGLRTIWRNGGGSSPRGSSPRGSPPHGAAARTALMAAWTFPFYADAALYAPETDSIADPRDRQFARAWHAALRDSVRRAATQLLRDTALPQQLFREVLRERELTRAVEGATIPLLYDAPMTDLAIVYVPGIFGELFDDEIWQRGLHALREQLGARIIRAGTDGRCSASDNATQLLATLRHDTKRRLERGYATPRYLIVGYSKGGVDAAEALARDTVVAGSQVVALVTIASPHGGTPVAERADLSDGLLDRVVAHPRPATCDTTHAVESLWPANSAAFWSTHGERLARHVPLVSLALSSDMQSAHPWMKITKRIAQFAEQNDGVVSLRAARFPSSVPSIHLGTVTGDHIAARNASAFPQESVLEAIVLSLNELGMLEKDGAARWRSAIAAARAVHAEPRVARRAPMAVGPSAADSVRAPTRTPTRLPDRHGDWRPDRTFRMNNLEALADRAITEATLANMPDGITLTCDQSSIVDFRREYEFLYDAGNGGSDDTPGSGFSIVSDSTTASGQACRFRTLRSAMKMTTVAFRFGPEAFPEFSLRANVLRGVRGSTAAKGGRGRNDANLKLWYVLRDERPEAKGRRVLFGYMWSVPDADGHTPAADSLVEGGASRRRIAFSVLPEARVMHLGSATREGEWLTVQRDFSADLRRAFPHIPLDQLRVIALTIQTDSDDSNGESDVLLDYLSMRPRRR